MKYTTEYTIYTINAMVVEYKLFKKIAVFLVYSNNFFIREKVAEMGYGLDKLVYDPIWEVREEVARHGYGLDILVNDPNWMIRYVVAKHSYGLEKLINDSNKEVKELAQKKLMQQDEIYY